MPRDSSSPRSVRGRRDRSRDRRHRYRDESRSRSRSRSRHYRSHRRRRDDSRSRSRYRRRSHSPRRDESRRSRDRRDRSRGRRPLDGSHERRHRDDSRDRSGRQNRPRDESHPPQAEIRGRCGRPESEQSQQTQGQLLPSGQQPDGSTFHPSRELEVSGSVQRGNPQMGVRSMPTEQSRSTSYLTRFKKAPAAHAFCGGQGSDGHHFLHSALDKALQQHGYWGDYELSIKQRPRPSSKGEFFGSSSGYIAPQRARAIEAAFDRSTSPEPRPAGLKPNIVCRACMSPGHSVRDCIWTDSQHGDIQACPFCETFGLHLPEDCPERSSFGRADIWDFFVVRRGGKSQVRTGNHDLLWSQLVHFRLRDHPDEAQLTLYPHSLDFAVDRLLENTERWRAHDYNAEPLNLVADPRTDDRARILADDGLFVLSGAIPMSNEQPDMDIDEEGGSIVGEF